MYSKALSPFFLYKMEINTLPKLLFAVFTRDSDTLLLLASILSTPYMRASLAWDIKPADIERTSNFTCILPEIGT